MRNPLSKMVAEMEPSGIRRFFDVASTMDNVISLGVGEPDFDTPWHIREEGIYSLEKGRTFYTSNAGLLPLRKEVCTYLKRRFALSYDSDEVIITVGGSELACMPKTREDVDTLLNATAAMKEEFPDFPLITMSMGELGKVSRLYGGLYGSFVSFGCVSEASAPGQVYYETMCEVFDKIYKGNRHIILIGFMGVGKSTISHELSRLASRIEIDTDQWIEEKEGRAISDIFEKEGETYFRDLETSMIDELGMIKPAIISCGGGMALRELNVRKLQAIGTVVLLTAKPETIFERVRYNTNRPLLKDNMNVDYIRQMMEKRRVYYEHAATVTVSTDGKIITEIAKEILEKCF